MQASTRAHGRGREGVEAGRVELLQLQAEEIRLKAVGGIYWLASALEVRSRLWLGGLISHSRDRHLLRSLLIRVRSSGRLERILLLSDGLASYAGQALCTFSGSRFLLARLAVRGWY